MWQGGPPNCFEKGHELAFVVASPARHDLFALRPRLQFRLKRRIAPEIQRVDRLDVIMAVKQNIRRLAARGLDVAHDHRTACGRALGRLESEIA
jgi:hypothetical protein